MVAQEVPSGPDQPGSPRQQQARFPPIAAWLSAWDRPAQLALAGLARRRDDGDIALHTALIDLGCLGVKNHRLHQKVTFSMAEFLVANAVTFPVQHVDPGLVSAFVRSAAAW